MVLNASDHRTKSNTCVIKSKMEHSKKKLSLVCGDSIASYDASNESQSSATNFQKTYTEGKIILVCENPIVCVDVSDVSSSSSDVSQKLCAREKTTPICVNQSVCDNATDDSTSSNEDFLQPCIRLVRSQRRKKGISIWDQLIRLKTFDHIGRENLINNLAQLIYKQNSLESICLEGLSLTPDEGVRLLLALYNSRETMKYVYCWRAFEKMVGISVETDDRVGSRFYENKKIKKCDWFRAISCLEYLTTLSINYAYIATPTGDLLINLAKKLQRNWQWLQLLCLEEEIYRNSESANNREIILIPDKAWKKAHLLAPALKIQYAIIGIPEYDIHKRFFTKNTQIHTFALSTSIDLKFRQPWFLDCTIKTLCSWYSNTLVYLCLQLWHNRENLDNQLRKLFLNLPSLQVFEFIGEIRMLKTLCAMCCQICSGSCNVYRVNMQLQEVIHDDIDKEKWIKSIKCLMICFKHDFDRMDVKFDISFYKF